jgi:hypothetical protein
VTDTSGFFNTQASRDVPRDRYGRYLLPDASGQDTGWTRATTFASTLAESYGLRIWEQRQVVWGLSRRPDLLTLASTISGPEDKKALGAIVDSAHEAGATQAKANWGSAVHKAIEQVEKGQPFGSVPDELKDAVVGYFREIADKGLVILPEYVERTCIVPAYKVAGTFDNLVRCPDGKLRVLDKKTGNLDYAEIEFAVQMALYANATALRNYGSNVYEPMPEVAKDYAIIAHIDRDTGRTELHRINIRLGWAWAATCAEVQDIRKTKHVLTPYVPEAQFPAKMMIVGEPTPPVSVPPRPSAAELAKMDHHASVSSDREPMPPASVWDQPECEEDDAPFVPAPGVPAAAPSTAAEPRPFAGTDVVGAPPTPPAVGVPAEPPPFPVAGEPAQPNSAAPLASSPTTEPADADLGAVAVALADDEVEELAKAIVAGAKSKARVQQIARDIMAAAAERGAVDELKLNQQQIRLARDIVRHAAKWGVPLPTFEKPRRAAPSSVPSDEDRDITHQLKYIRSMPTVQGLVEYQANLGDRWTDEHTEAARVRVEEINAAAPGDRPLTPAEIIAGATSPETLQMAWRNATGSGANAAGWTSELNAAAEAKAAEIGSSAPAA